MVMTILILIVSISILIAAGLPLTSIVFKQQEIQQKNPAFLWSMSLFTGICIIAIVLKTFTAFNVPVKYTAWPLAVVIMIGLVIFIFRSHKHFLFPSKAFIFGFLGVLLIQSVGYLFVGAAHYLGDNWWDNIFYVTQSQFQVDYPCNTTFDSIPNAPWMAYVILDPTHRISRSMLQGFISVLCGVPTEYTIGLISVLSPVLTYCAMYFVTERVSINKRIRIAVCFFAAMIPGLATLHLEGFLGASLAVPFLILWCPLFDTTVEKPTIGKMLLCSMILATTATIYTESILILIAFSVIIFIWSICTGKTRIRNVYVPVLTFIAVLLINIQFIHFSSLLSRSGNKHDLDFIYDFAQTGAGLSFAYFGGKSIKILGIVAIFFGMAGICGLICSFFENKNPTLLSLISFTLSPIMFCYGSEVYAYSYFRLILMSSPIIVFGFWLFIEKIYVQIKQSNMKKAFFMLPFKRIFCGLLAAFALCVSVIQTAGTGRIVSRTITESVSRLGALQPTAEVTAIRQKIYAQKGKNVFLISKLSLNAWWLMYYARNNKVWLCHESLDNYYVPTQRTDYTYLNYNNMPDPKDVEIVVDPSYYNPITSTQKSDRLGAYMVSNTNKQVIDPGELSDSSYDLNIYSKEALSGTLKLTISGEASSTEEPINIKINGKYFSKVSKEDVLEIPVSISKGFNHIMINTVADSERVVNRITDGKMVDAQEVSEQETNNPKIVLSDWKLEVK